MEVDKFSLSEAVTGVTDLDNGNLKLAECCLVTFIRALALAIILSSSINPLALIMFAWICIFMIVCCLLSAICNLVWSGL